MAATWATARPYLTAARSTVGSSKVTVLAIQVQLPARCTGR